MNGNGKEGRGCWNEGDYFGGGKELLRGGCLMMIEHENGHGSSRKGNRNGKKKRFKNRIPKNFLSIYLHIFTFFSFLVGFGCRMVLAKEIHLIQKNQPSEKSITHTHKPWSVNHELFFLPRDVGCERTRPGRKRKIQMSMGTGNGYGDRNGGMGMRGWAERERKREKKRAGVECV